jgi:hypothetical protein
MPQYQRMLRATISSLFGKQIVFGFVLLAFSFCPFFHKSCEHVSTRFIRGDLLTYAKFRRREISRMFDMTVVLLAGLGGASLTVAFLDYRFSRKRRTEAKA